MIGRSLHKVARALLGLSMASSIALAGPLVDIGYGDSMMAAGNNGSAATAAALPIWPYVATPWLSILAAKRGEISDNKGHGGFTVVAQAAEVFASTPAANTRTFYMAGRADLAVYGSGTGAISQFQKSLAALTYWLSADKMLATSTAWTYTGAWTNNSIYGLGKYTTTNGATASFSITGDVLSFQQVVSDGNNSSITVKSDGVTVGTFPSVGDMTIAQVGMTPIWAPALREISGLGAGNHAIVITANVPVPAGALDFAMLDYYVTGSSGLPVLLVTSPRTLHPAFPDTAVAAYNAKVLAVAAQAAARGLNVVPVDAGPDIDPAKNLTDDLEHLSNAGQHNMAGAVGYRAGL